MTPLEYIVAGTFFLLVVFVVVCLVTLGVVDTLLYLKWRFTNRSKE